MSHKYCRVVKATYADLATFTNTELRAYAKRLGVSTVGLRRKVDIIDRMFHLKTPKIRIQLGDGKQ